MVMMLVFDTEVKGSIPFIPYMNYKWWFKSNVVYKKQNLKFYSKVSIKNFNSFFLANNIGSNLKKQSNYFSGYEFKVILMNAILRGRSYCVCRYSLFIERILNIF